MGWARATLRSGVTPSALIGCGIESAEPEPEPWRDAPVGSFGGAMPSGLRKGLRRAGKGAEEGGGRGGHGSCWAQRKGVWWRDVDR